jgi:EAL domain-containing protein (putative c-di-GMP-specific phosphodiesterase class I)
MDIQIGIDNFGLGYFSLNNLHDFPIQKLEIDRSFITSMNKESWSSALPRAIISLAKHLEMDVVAEGVENEDQFRQLKKFDCGYAQGHYFSPPVDRKKAGALLLKDPVWI